MANLVYKTTRFMPENLIAEYPLNTWVLDLEYFFGMPNLVAKNRISNGGLHIRPSFTTVKAITFYPDGLIFCFPYAEDQALKLWRENGSYYNIRGVSVLTSDDLDNLRKSHGLPFLPEYFEYEVFNDIKLFKSPIGKNKVFKKWQSMAKHSDFVLIP